MQLLRYAFMVHVRKMLPWAALAQPRMLNHCLGDSCHKSILLNIGVNTVLRLSLAVTLVGYNGTQETPTLGFLLFGMACSVSVKHLNAIAAHQLRIAFVTPKILSADNLLSLGSALKFLMAAVKKQRGPVPHAQLSTASDKAALSRVIKRPS